MNLKKTLRTLQTKAYRDPSLSTAIEPLGHAYPWQILTKLIGLQLTAKLDQHFNAEPLREELAEILSNFAPKQQFGQYHLGGWQGISLHAIDGNPSEDQDDPQAEFAKTPALKYAATMEAIIDSIPCEKRRVRILQLAPGRKVFWHRDFFHSIDSTQIRLHIPIITNDKVGFQISHQDCPWQPGELWYGDFTFPHRLQNGGDKARVHLVIDLMNNDEAAALLPDNLLGQRNKRLRARKNCNRLMNIWSDVFATERRLALSKKDRPN